MSRRELPAGMPAREGPESAVTALVRAVLAAECCDAAGEIMTPARYRHPGDVIRLYVATAG